MLVDAAGLLSVLVSLLVVADEESLDPELLVLPVDELERLSVR